MPLSKKFATAIHRRQGAGDVVPLACINYKKKKRYNIHTENWKDLLTTGHSVHGPTIHTPKERIAIANPIKERITKNQILDGVDVWID